VVYLDGSALNIRPCPPALREALHQLAQAEGMRLYDYLLVVLARHVDHAHQDQCAGGGAGAVSTSA
jgi:hypothetical protein